MRFPFPARFVFFLQTRTAAIVARAAESSLAADKGPIGGYVPLMWPAVVGLAVYALLGAGAFFCESSRPHSQESLDLTRYLP